jgi:hypothetical protein
LLKLVAPMDFCLLRRFPFLFFCLVISFIKCSSLSFLGNFVKQIPSRFLFSQTNRRDKMLSIYRIYFFKQRNVFLESGFIIHLSLLSLSLFIPPQTLMYCLMRWYCEVVLTHSQISRLLCDLIVLNQLCFSFLSLGSFE